MLRGLKKDGPRPGRVSVERETASPEQTGNAAAKGNREGEGGRCGGEERVDTHRPNIYRRCLRV